METYVIIIAGYAAVRSTLNLLFAIVGLEYTWTRGNYVTETLLFGSAAGIGFLLYF